MSGRTKSRWVTGIVAAILVIPLVNILSYGAMAWLNGAGHISSYKVAGLNRTVYYPLFAYKESTLPGANSLNDFYFGCMKAGAESQFERDEE